MYVCIYVRMYVVVDIVVGKYICAIACIRPQVNFFHKQIKAVIAILINQHKQ